MSVYDLYQSYLNQMKSPVVPEESGVDPNYLLYLQQQQQMQGGGDGVSTFSPNLAVGQQPPSALMTGIMSMIAPPIGLAMGAQRMADKGMLGPLNSLFASRSSANVEMGLPQAINMQSLFNDFGFGNRGGVRGGFTGTPSQMAAMMSEMSGPQGGFSDGTSSASDGGEAGAAAASAAGANDGPGTGGSF